MFKRLLIIGAAVLFGTAAYSQDSLSFKSDELVLEYDKVLPADLKVKGPVQGFAIHKNYLYGIKEK